MGGVGHRELIRVLSFVVVLDMAVGVVALAVRTGDRSERTTQYAGSTGIPLDTKNGSVLAGGKFNNRRNTGGSDTTEAPAISATTAPVAPPNSAVAPPTSGPATTPSTAAPTTATTRKPPVTTATTRAAGGSTSTTGRPAGAAAPPVTTATGPNGAVKNGGKLGDPVGDTFVDGTQDPIQEGRADIVRARAVYGPDRITFVLQVDQPSDPAKDERWASDSTFANWEVDTNGDGTADFEVQYYIDEGTYGGVVSKPGAAELQIACEVETAGYGPDGYAITVPSSCLGEPASFQYRVTMFYDTNPADENADVASDVAPNGGLSFPISRGA